jgi:hypothetical protein
MGRVVSDLVPIGKEFLTLEQYRQLEDVPPELEWLANITNLKIRRAYKIDVANAQRSLDCANPRNCARSHAPMSLPGARRWRPAI